MKKCGYCGRENDEAATHCGICRTELMTAEAKAESGVVADSTPRRAPGTFTNGVITPNDVDAPMEFWPLSLEDTGKSFVTLMTCRTLLDAEIVVNHLASAEIPAFIPDQMLALSANMYSFGFVRVQVSPLDYEAAKEFLSGLPDAPE